MGSWDEGKLAVPDGGESRNACWNVAMRVRRCDDWVSRAMA